MLKVESDKSISERVCKYCSLNQVGDEKLFLCNCSFYESKRYRFFKHIIVSGPEDIKLFSYSTQLSMKFFLLINVKMPTIIVGILTFISGKNRILGISEPEKC